MHMPNQDDFRVKRIQKMLLEMAKGNFFYSLEPSEQNDNISALVLMLNMVNEEIRASFIHQGFANAHHAPQCIIQLSLLLDGKGTIEMATKSSCSLLSCLPQDLIGRPITQFMTEGSRTKWTKKWPKLMKKDSYETKLHLEFLTQEGLTIKQDFNVSAFHTLDGTNKKLLLDSVFFVKGEPFSKGIPKNKLMVTKGTKRHKVKMDHKDIQIIRDLHDMIINNLEKDLPGLHELALQMGTNEYKLKYGFKQMYGTTIFRFLTQERLRKAKTLIQHSTLTIKQVSQMTGFKSKTHFSRAFKDKYGLTPTAMRD